MKHVSYISKKKLGDMMANIREIAKRAGIGIATMSRYFNDSGYVSEESREKIRKAVEELDYTPNALARAIFKKNTKIIGLMIPNITNPFFNQMVSEMEKLFRKQNYTIILCNTDDDKEKEQFHIETLRSYRVAGIVAMRTMTPESYRNIDIPVIAFENQISPEHITVASDNYKGGMAAFKHLYDGGCRKILHIQGPEVFIATTERLRGFIEASKKKKDALVDVVKLETDFHIKSLEPAIENIKNITDYDGIFVFNDISAAVVMKHLHDLGVRIPKQTQIIGFDNSFLGELLLPSLTTIDQPIKQLGKITTDLMIRLINGEEIDQKEYYLKTTVIKRSSTLGKIATSKE